MLSARLGKCRLCLKLGDFYSIFDDSALELANMAMQCANIQVQKGDGLPDKVCTECIEKLSASYIFKQQCERSDAELRKSLSLTLGEKPSNSNKTNHSSNKNSPKKSTKKSSHGGDGLLREHYSVDVDENTSESSKTVQKRARDEISDSEDSVDDNCSKRSKRSSKASDSHSLINVGKNADDSISSAKSNSSILDSVLRFSCKACGKKFKYNVAVLNHMKVCQEAKVTQVQENNETVFTCTKCGKFYQTQSRLQSHIQNCKLPTENTRKQDVCPVDCSNCGLMFPNHMVMYQHFHSCLREGGPQIIACNSCKITYVQKNSLYRHIMKNHNAELNSSQNSIDVANNESIDSGSGNLKCRKCSKVFSTQNQLVTHLAAHMANINDEDSNEQNSIGETIKYTCLYCDASFQYEHNLVAHVKNEHEQNEESEITDGKKNIYTCDICSKTFTSKVSYGYHMNVKHNEKSIKRHKTKATSKPINLYNCAATCLKCQVHLRNGSEISVHNKMHRLENAKIQNRYDCPACEQTFTNTKLFRAHINFHNSQSHKQQKQAESSQSDEDNNSQTDEKDEEEYQNPLDFCETVVANIKSEPIEYSEQSENYHSSLSNYSQVLSVNLGGFSCTVCHKILPNLERYNNHIKQHKSKIHKCLICDQIFEFNSRLRIHMKDHEKQAKEDSSVLDCRICGHNLKSIRSYLFHMNLHSQTEQFECPVCQRMFKTKTAYISHHKSHYYKKSSGVPNQSNEESLDGKTQFQCHICRKCMPSAISLKYHVKWHQSSTAQKKKTYECMKCDQIFNCKQRYASHMSQHRIHENSNNLECKICKKTFENSTKLKWHIKAHRATTKLKKKNHPCAVCNQNFKFQSKLIEHVKRRHPISKMVKKSDPDGAPVQNYVCKICGKHFNTDAEMMTHRKRHSTKTFTSFKCTLCNKRSKNLKFHQQHVKGHLYQKLYGDEAICPHCDEEFDRRNKMNQHLATVHNVIENYTIRVYGKEKIKHTNELISLECRLCNKVLASQTTFQKHMDVHNSMRCNYCYKYFNSKMFLDAHLTYDCQKKNLLKGSDPFEKRLKCHVCLKPFSLAVKLNCHLRVQHKAEPKATHTKKEKYFACDFCFSTFSHEDKMLNHKQIHVRPGYFGCKYCPRKFVNMIKFRKHKRNHYFTKYVDDPLSCSECPEKFVLLNDLLIHLEKIHNISNDWSIPPQEPVSELCHICNKEFTHLANHLVFHEKYKCKKCSEYFFSEIDFNSHACSVESEDESNHNTIMGNNEQTTNFSVPYEECEFCFKSYTTNFTKAAHAVNHSRINTFGCKFCGKTFTSTAIFNLHNLAHRMRSYKLTPLICQYCDQTFIKYALYTKHLTLDHQEKESMKIKPEYPPEECVICKKTFPNIHHHYRHHMNFRCRTCSKYITSQKLFENHKCDNSDEDQSLIFTCDENIIPKTVAAFDYKPHLFKTAESGEIVKEKEHSDSHDTIDINECELDDTILQSFDCSENTSQTQSVNNDENTVESFDIIDIDDSSNEFAPRISSTVSLSASNEQDVNVD